MSNKEVIKGFYREIINEKDFSLLDKYYHEDYLTGALPYIGMGAGIDSKEDKAVVFFVYPDGPSAGKLLVGDEIISVQDDEILLETFDEIKDSSWGWGKVGSILKLGVLRDGEEIEVEITRGIIEGLRIPLNDFRENWEKTVKEKYPDQKAEILQIIEEGDLVACLTVYSGTDLEYDRQILVPEMALYRLQDGKISEDWSAVDNLQVYRQLGFRIEQPEKKPETS